MNNKLKKRIIEVSYKYGLSHLGSCLSAVDIIDEIYAIKKREDKFVLSAGHAGLALYAVLEKQGFVNAEAAFLHHGVHPDRCDTCHIDCSSGSLGNGLPIALGMALADPKHDVYCLVSDGECAEGSVWEALRIWHEQDARNLKIYVNINGHSALGDVDISALMSRLYSFGAPNIRRTTVEQLPFLKGVNAHYKVMNEKEYQKALEVFK